ncbi:DUF4767 domain-containing protein [Companilactobacillus sp.]|uniref:Lreu_0056 family protein n=1 Tax=Companilactobacillus sp. TaxID=2767905 RepID=UPI0026195081|nr:DUF4767 domain-containing protein [Companilactobacillus sp.]
MQHNNWKKIAILSILIIAITGCSNNSSKKQSSSQTKTEQTQPKKAAPLWNNSKDKKLGSYMKALGWSWNTAFKEYSGHGSMVTSIGATFPKDFSKATVEDSKDSIGWSKTGNGSKDYNVVAIYDYDNQNAAIEGHQTFFFAFHKKQPVVLVSDTQSAKPIIKKSTRKELNTAFTNMAQNKKVTFPSVGNMKDVHPQADSTQKSDDNDNAEVTVTDPKTVGIMVYQNAASFYDPSTFSEGLHLYTLDDGKYELDTGTAASEITYQIQGDTVHYWTLDPDSGESIAEQTKKESTIPLKELVSKYYSTSDQKQAVQHAVSLLQEQ